MNATVEDFNFDQFWSAYPRKVAPRYARAKYHAALRVATHEEIMAGLLRYIEDLESRDVATEYIAHPATWLNRGRWEDEYESASGKWGDAN